MKKKKCFENVKSFLLFFMLTSVHFFGQDSIPEARDLTEEKEMKFQQFFFKALSEKSIGNHQKAIENLESCNQIVEKDAAVFFEFSKNYLALNKILLAREYIERALQKQPNNFWMQKHLANIFFRARNYKEAVRIQEKLVEKNAKEEAFLVNLYVYSKEPQKALLLLNKMEKKNTLSLSLIRLKNNLENRNKKPVVEEYTNKSVSLKEQFKSNKSYMLLKQILNTTNNPNELLEYANQGIILYPAQPLVYLSKAKALNLKNKFNEAIKILKIGIDFVIEENMEFNFYKEMATAYRGLGKFEEEKKYLKKSKKVKS